MNGNDQQQLGKTLWAIADQLRGAMNADDFRDYMLAFLFLRYLSDNYESAVKKELGKDYPKASGDGRDVPLVRGRRRASFIRRSRFRASSRPSSRSTARSRRRGGRSGWKACSTSPAALVRCC